MFYALISLRVQIENMVKQAGKKKRQAAESQRTQV